MSYKTPERNDSIRSLGWCKAESKTPQSFGCDAYVHIPKDERGKFDSKARKCILVGYSSEKVKAIDSIILNKES